MTTTEGENPNMHRPFAPNGSPIASITVECITGCPASFGLDGVVEQDAFGDFPEFMDYTTKESVQYLMDIHGNEWLESHCRLVLVDKEWDSASDHENTEIDAWDDDICNMCGRVARLRDGVRQLKALERLLPVGWFCATTTVAVETILLGRMEGEITELEAQIATYRTGRTEIEHIDEMPCFTCKGAGGEPMPCDECGAMKAETEEELLQIADDTYRAKIGDFEVEMGDG